MRLLFLRTVLIFAIHALQANAHSITVTYGSRHGGSDYVKIGVVITSSTLNQAISATDQWGSPISLDGFQCYKWDRTNQTWITDNWDDLSQSWLLNHSISAGDALMIRTPTFCYVHLSGTRETGTIQVNLPPGLTCFAIPADTTLNGLCSSASFTPAIGDQAWCGPEPGIAWSAMSPTCNWDDLSSPPVWLYDYDVYEGSLIIYRNASSSSATISLDF